MERKNMKDGEQKYERRKFNYKAYHLGPWSLIGQKM